MGRLNDKVCIITGASSGIGAKTSELFAKEGAKVMMIGRREEALAKQAAAISAYNSDISYLAADISDVEAVNAAAAATLEKFGKIDVLCNIAGVLDMGMRPIEVFKDDELEQVLSINLKGTMYITRAVTKVFSQQGFGNVETVASVAGTTGNGSAVYSASKGALVALTKNIALRFANKTPPIRANCLCPGTVWTPMTKKASAAKPKYTKEASELMATLQDHTTLNVGICHAEDVANALLFLSSDESKCINGQIITIDCGANL